MDIIKKEVNFDTLLSHVDGVVPFLGMTDDESGLTNYMKIAYDIQLEGISGKTIDGEDIIYSGKTEFSGKTEEGDDIEIYRIRHCTLLKDFNIIKEILRNSIHLRRQRSFNCNDSDCTNLYLRDFTYLSGLTDFLFEENLYVLPESDSAVTKVNDTTYKIENEEIESCENTYVILISDDDLELYNAYGGIDFFKNSYDILFSGGTSDTLVPYLPIPILFTSEHADLGIMTTYYDLFDENIFEDGNTLDWFEKKETIERYIDCSNLKKGSTIVSGDNITTLSKLESLREPEYVSDDSGTVLPGIFQDFEGTDDNTRGKYFQCFYYTGQTTGTTIEIYERDSTESAWRMVGGSSSYEKPWPINSPYKGYILCLEQTSSGNTNTDETISEDGLEKTVTITGIVDWSWWEPVPCDGTDLVCADDEYVEPRAEKYRTLTVFETVKQMVTELNDGIRLNHGDYYYFLVKFDNANETPMRMPYVVNLVLNKDFDPITSAYTGDYIINIEKTDKTVKFDYVIGAIFSDNTYDVNTCVGGVKYSEQYFYDANKESTFNIDGYTGIKYWYENIDFESSKLEIINRDFNMTMLGNLTNVMEIPLGDVWNKDGSIINAPLIKEELLMGLSFDPKIELDVEIDRGNAAAFERHLKLSECNSLQDLEEIGNGYYNL